MRIGVNLWIWGSPFRTDRHLAVIPAIKSWGGDVIEFAMEDDAVVETNALRQVLQNEDMGCSIVGLFGPDRDLSLDDAARQRGIDYARRCIDVCAEVGAAIFSGAVVGVGGQVLLADAVRRSRIERAADSLRELGQYAAQAGVRFVVEVLNRYENNLLNTAAQARELIDLTDHPAVEIHLDSFHMNIEEHHLGDAIRRAGEKLMHLHGSESHRGTPGTGLVRWDQVAAALRDIHYEGDVIIESLDYKSPLGPLARFWRPFALSPEDLARDGLAFLKRTLLS